MPRELHVRPSRVHADRAYAGKGHLPHFLILAVGQGLRRGDGDRVSGMHAHRVDVFDRADDDAVVAPVAHHLELELVPAFQEFLDQHLVSRRERLRGAEGIEQFLFVADDARAQTAEGKRGAQQQRIAEHVDALEQFFLCLRGKSVREGKPGLLHRLAKHPAVLRAADRLGRRADHPDLVLFKQAGAMRGHREVETGLPAHRGQHGVGLFGREDFLQGFEREGFQIGPVREARVGHDRRGVGVEEEGAQTVFAQCLQGLDARVVEFAGLADDDRAGADEEDGFDGRDHAGEFTFSVGGLTHSCTHASPVTLRRVSGLIA